MEQQQPKMSGAIAAAIVAIQAGVKKLGKEGNNQHGRYKYTSVDAFYEALGPLMADHKLATISHEESATIFTNEKTGALYVDITYSIFLVHESGDMYGPIPRSITMPNTGPQTYGAAEAYITKYFLRDLFKVPTGENIDADNEPNNPVPPNPNKKPKVDAAQKALLQFVDKVNEFLDSDPTPEALFTYEGKPENTALFTRMREGYKGTPAVDELLKRMNAIYAKAPDAPQE